MIMMRIVSFAGSFRGEKSQTKRASDMLAEHVKIKAAEEDIEVSYECITADQLRIEHCRGCKSCFKTGTCPLDSKDDMPLLKQRILDADAFFLCTPVYLWEMSGITKTLIDRITYWSHRFELAGKACVTIASTDSSIDPGLEDRLKQYMSFLGISVADGIAVKNSAVPNINRYDEVSPIMDAAAERLIAAYKDPASFITEMQNAAWYSRKIIVRQALKMKEIADIEPPEEIKVFIERGAMDCGSLAEYIEKVRKSEE